MPRTLRPTAIEQLRLLTEWKAARTDAERRIDSQLLFALDRQAGRLASALAKVEVAAIPKMASSTRLEVEIELLAGADLAPLVAQVRQLGGTIGFTSARFRVLRATVATEAIRALAALAGVRRIAPARPVFTHAVVSEGDRTHAADRLRDIYALDGQGIHVCVLSNGVDGLTESQSTGELPAVAILPGQEGGGSEGTAMLEIVHDLAPAATLGFATAFDGIASFAQNILDLAASGCRVIVDDVIYVVESPFQDGPLAAAVDEVAAQGVLYLSSAGNEGNLDDGTSGTWEGDFVAGAALPALPGLELHDFGGGEVANRVLDAAPAVILHWTDPFTTAANDYDLYVLSEDLSEVVRFSNDTQDGIGGDDDPVEVVSFFGSGADVGERLVVARSAGEGRLFNLIGFRGELDLATRGALRGHSAASGALAIAAAPAAVPLTEDGPTGPYPLEFDAGQLSETFSADGPRRIFFSPEGTLLPGAPPGDFSATGGVVREKPDLTAADGVATSVDEFRRFFGTSAAAPHAAALAALYWSALPAATADEVRAALLDGALDIETPGTDPTTGHGLVDLDSMLAVANVPLRANLALGAVATTELAGNGDAVLDPGERWHLDVELANVGGAAATAIAGVLGSSDPWVVLEATGSLWPDLGAGVVAASKGGFDFGILPGAPCGERLAFTLTVLYQGGVAPEVLPFVLTLGAAAPTIRFDYAGPPVFIADSPMRGVPGPPALASIAVGDLGGRLMDLDLALEGELCTTAVGATTVGIEHPFVGNLQIELVAPSGFATPLVRLVGGLGHNFCQTLLDDESTVPVQSLLTKHQPFSGSFLPARALGQLDGEEPEGLWTLRVTDWNPLDVGHVRAFSLRLTPAACRSFEGVVEVPAAGPIGLVALSLLLAWAAIRQMARRRSDLAARALSEADAAGSPSPRPSSAQGPSDG